MIETARSEPTRSKPQGALVIDIKAITASAREESPREVGRRREDQSVAVRTLPHPCDPIIVIDAMKSARDKLVWSEMVMILLPSSVLCRMGRT